MYGFMWYDTAAFYGNYTGAGIAYGSNDMDVDEWLDSWYFPWSYYTGDGW